MTFEILQMTSRVVWLKVFAGIPPFLSYRAVNVPWVERYSALELCQLFIRLKNTFLIISRSPKKVFPRYFLHVSYRRTFLSAAILTAALKRFWKWTLLLVEIEVDPCWKGSERVTPQPANPRYLISAQSLWNWGKLPGDLLPLWKTMFEQMITWELGGDSQHFIRCLIPWKLWRSAFFERTFKEAELFPFMSVSPKSFSTTSIWRLLTL